MEKNLYGIEVLYVNGASKPVLRSAPIQRETEKLYIIESKYGFLGYRAHIPKDKVTTFLTPLKAWQNYAARCYQNILQIDAERTAMTNFEIVAQVEIGKLIEAGQREA